MVQLSHQDKTPISYTQILQKSISFVKPIYKQKGKGIKMEETAQERLMQFIHSLSDEECKMIVSFIESEKYTIGDSD
jgi:hypothetical protein